MTEWTDEQLKIILGMAKVADGGCCYCVREVLEEFLDLTSWDLLPRLDSNVENKKEFAGFYPWEQCRPNREEENDD